MADQITDGAGSGYKAHVNANNQLSVLAATVELRHHVVHVHNKAFCMLTQTTPIAGGAFAYIKNLDSADLNVWSLNMRCAAAECIEVWQVSGTGAGNANSPSNCVVGSGITSTATVLDGNNITGLTKVKILKRYWLEAAKQSLREAMGTALILPEGNAIAFYAVTGSALVDLCVSFDFHSVE